MRTFVRSMLRETPVAAEHDNLTPQERLAISRRALVAQLQGREHRAYDGDPLDVLVLATGFRVDSFVRPMRVAGDRGVMLDDVWADGPFAYMTLAVPGFPNFYMLNGPNGPVGNFSLMSMIGSPPWMIR